MKTQEENIIILLRKILALAFPDDFEATEDTNRKAILIKLQNLNSDLHKTINEFLIAFESHHFIMSDYQLKLKAADVWKTQLQMFRDTLALKKENLIKACKNLHINIDYELENLMN